MTQLNDSFQFPNGIRIKNRLVMAPMTTDSGTRTGALSQEDQQFIIKRSKDFGAVIIGSHSISDNGLAFERGWKAYGYENQVALTQLVSELHNQNVKVILQLYHAGRMAQPAFIKGAQPIGPSRIPAVRSFASYPREMTGVEIAQVIADFKRATHFALACGCDGVEIHGANTYLVQQFYSPHSNRRQDKWGKHLLFPTKVVEAVLEAIGDQDLIVGYRFSPEEYETPGIRLDDTQVLLETLDKYPLDYVHISVDNFQKKARDGRDIIATLRTRHPFIACGAINSRQDVENALGQADLVSIGNPVVIDPDWAGKVLRRSDDVKLYFTTHNAEEVAIPLPLWETLQSSPLRYFGKGDFQ